jgi:deazaflavin-dependent oxidoreductase (nitroreductase family)
MAWDATAFEDALIADMRAHDGAVTSGPLAGHPLLVMTSTGASSGKPRRAILTYSRDGDDYVVAGTAGGAPTAPKWLRNLRATPEVEVETGNRTFRATTRVVDDPAERDRLWEGHVRRNPNFAQYPSQTGRVIPIVRITPAEAA